MQFKQLLKDDDAVSPVIGVILMVAITVILAAVIGTFVLGLGEQVQSTSPQASFNFELDQSTDPTNSELANGTTDSDDGVLDITHETGDSVDSARLSVNDGGNQGPIEPFSGEVTAGTTVSVDVDSNDEVRIIWDSEDGETSATLGQWSGPEA